jgi:hypothetical protein
MRPAVLAVALAAALAVPAGCTSAPPEPLPAGSDQPLRPRAAHTATLLPDGRVILIGGCAVDGCTTAEVEPSTEYFEPGAGFTAGPAMVHPRSGHTATSLRDGRILVAGGWAREGTAPLARAEVFDPATGAFSELNHELTVGNGLAAALPDGRVLLAGEGGSEVFDPVTDTFAPAARLPQPRHAAIAVTLADGDVLVVGGADESGAGRTSTVVYDVGDDAWRPGPELSTPRFKHALARLADGRVLVLGGTTDDVELVASTEVLDVDAGTSEPGPRLSDAMYKFDTGVVATDDGRIVAAGGHGVEVLEPGASAFEVVPTATGPWRSFATATALPDGPVLVVGGYDERIGVHRDAFVVDGQVRAAASVTSGR